MENTIFEAFKVNRISVSGDDYLECPSFNKTRLKFLKSGFFYAGPYCTHFQLHSAHIAARVL